MSTTLIEIPQWGTWTLIEALWLAAGVLALGVSSVRIRVLWWDYQDTRALGEDDLRLLARGYLRREIVRIATATDIIAIGLYVGLQAAPVPGPAYVTVGALVLTAGLIVVALLVSVQSILDWRDRRAIREAIRRSR